MKACQNKSTNISTDDGIQNPLVKNPEKDIDIDSAQELSADKLVKSNHEIETDLQFLITDFADFKKYVFEVFASSIGTNQSNDLRDTKYSHNIISDLQNVIKSKDQIINLLRNSMKTLQGQLNVNESNTWKYVSSISHKNYKHKTRAENSNCGIKTSNRFTTVARDIHTSNKDNTAENDVQNVTNISINNNTNNTSETKKSKKSRKVSHNTTTPFFVNRRQQQQQQRNSLFF